MSSPSRPGVPHARRPAAPGTLGSTRPASSAGRPPGGPTSSTPQTGALRRAAEPAPLVQAAPVRGSWGAMLSWKTLVLVLVLGLAVALVLPSLRVYTQQQAELGALHAERDAARAEVDDLTAQIARWNDPAFVVAQARERLAYVFPGETPFRVVDPEFVSVAGSASGTAAKDDADARPWFATMWGSIIEVGEGPPLPAVEDTPPEEPVDEKAPLTTVDFGG